MTVLVTGACGLLGAHVVAALSPDHRMVGIDRHPWWGNDPLEVIQGDLLSDAFATETMRRVAPSIVVHCAAMVDVDACERQPDLAEACNARVTRSLARAAGSDTLFVYITTDGIFQGDRPFMTEADTPNPRTVYGWSKLHGEQEVQAVGDNHLIIRTNFYGWSSGRKKTSAEWLYRALAGNEALTGFVDFHFTPIYVVDFVERLRMLIASRHRGVFHVCGADRVSKYDFALQLADGAGLSAARIARGSIEAAGLVAPRPRDMSLSSEKFCRALGATVPGCAEGIRRFVAQRQIRLDDRFSAGVHPLAGD